MTVNLKGLVAKLNPATRAALEAAAALCYSRTHYEIEVEHFLLKLLDTERNDLWFIANRFGVDKSRLTAELNRSLDRFKTGNARTPGFSRHVIDSLSQAWLYGSLEQDARQIRSGFVILALLNDDQLSALVHEFSRELEQIRGHDLKRDFAAVVRGSVEEDTPAAPVVTGGTRVFVSYRRDDSDFYVDYLFASMLAEVPEVLIFRDSDTLKPGMVYAEKIEETIAACDILLSVIGKKWAGAKSGSRRLDSPDDWVRLEVAAALRQKKTVIPCLVGGARMPTKAEVPAELEGLIVRHAVTLSQNDLRRDARVLMDTLRAWRRPAS